MVLTRSTGAGRASALLVRLLVHQLTHASQKHWVIALGWVSSQAGPRTQDAVSLYPREACSPAAWLQDGDPGPSRGLTQNRSSALNHTHLKAQPHEQQGFQGKAIRGLTKNPEDLLFQPWGLTGKHQGLPIKIPKPGPLSKDFWFCLIFGEAV